MAFAVTSTVAPVSARIAGHRPVMPAIVVTRNTALSPSAMVMFWAMLPITDLDRAIMAGNVGDAAVQDRGVGRFQRDVGAAAHGDAEICRGKGRGIVDAVADLGHDLALLLQFADDSLLVVGEQAGPNRNAEAVADRARRRLVVAGQHHGADALGLERCERGNRVGDGARRAWR